MHLIESFSPLREKGVCEILVPLLKNHRGEADGGPCTSEKLGLEKGGRGPLVYLCFLVKVVVYTYAKRSQVWLYLEILRNTPLVHVSMQEHKEEKIMRGHPFKNYQHMFCLLCMTGEKRRNTVMILDLLILSLFESFFLVNLCLVTQLVSVTGSIYYMAQIGFPFSSRAHYLFIFLMHNTHIVSPYCFNS